MSVQSSSSESSFDLAAASKYKEMLVAEKAAAAAATPVVTAKADAAAAPPPLATASFPMEASSQSCDGDEVSVEEAAVAVEPAAAAVEQQPLSKADELAKVGEEFNDDGDDGESQKEEEAPPQPLIVVEPTAAAAAAAAAEEEETSDVVPTAAAAAAAADVVDLMPSWDEEDEEEEKEENVKEEEEDDDENDDPFSYFEKQTDSRAAAAAAVEEVTKKSGFSTLMKSRSSKKEPQRVFATAAAKNMWSNGEFIATIDHSRVAPTIANELERNSSSMYSNARLIFKAAMHSLHDLASSGANVQKSLESIGRAAQQNAKRDVGDVLASYMSLGAPSSQLGSSLSAALNQVPYIDTHNVVHVAKKATLDQALSAMTVAAHVSASVLKSVDAPADDSAWLGTALRASSAYCSAFGSAAPSSSSSRPPQVNMTLNGNALQQVAPAPVRRRMKRWERMAAKYNDDPDLEQ